jgi:hypothetical protein
VDSAIGTPSYLLFDDILVDDMVWVTVLPILGVLRPGIESLLDLPVIGRVPFMVSYETLKLDVCCWCGPVWR